jgi:hypothetical protein
MSTLSTRIGGFLGPGLPLHNSRGTALSDPVRARLQFCPRLRSAFCASPRHVPGIEIRVRPNPLQARASTQSSHSPAVIDGDVPGSGSRSTLSDSTVTTASHGPVVIVSPPVNSSLPTSFSSTPDMSHHSTSQSLTFQSLFDVALQDYENQTGTRLAEHPLAKQLETCYSVNSITSFLQERARSFNEFRGADGKFMRSLKRVVYVLYALSTNAALGESIGLVERREILLGISRILHILNSHSHQRKQYSPDSPSYSPYMSSPMPLRTFVSYEHSLGRPSKTPRRVIIHSWTYSNLWKASSTDSTFILNSLLPRSWRRS